MRRRPDDGSIIGCGGIGGVLDDEGSLSFVIAAADGANAPGVVHVETTDVGTTVIDVFMTASGQAAR